MLLAEAPDGTVAGYAACSAEFSFWGAGHYLPMDCLRLAEAALVDAVAALARELGFDQVPWQIPDGNEGAVRFHDRLGATGTPKRRYSLPSRPPASRPPPRPP